MKRVSTVVAFLLFCIALNYCYADDCTINDFVHEYTQCSKTDNTHSLVWYKNPTSNCTDGITLPAPTLKLNCSLTCEDGKYVDVEAPSTCTNCPSGTFGRGNAIYVDNWNYWPVGLTHKTYCVKSSSPNEVLDCPGWELDEFAVRSGKINDSQSSVLEFGVILSSPGHITFSYLVDAEAYWDGLYVSIDGVDLFGKVSSTNAFQTNTTQLDAGYHTIKFLYYKDLSESVGADAAFIQILDIAGVYDAWDAVCQQCVPGTYVQDGGAIDCDRCPLNTISTSFGASTCQDCAPTQYAFPGSDSCDNRIPCTSADYEILRGPCTATGQALIPTWTEPFICNNATGFQLPPPTSTSCPPCDPGFFRDGTYTCVPCPDGYSGGGEDGGNSCAPCFAGEAAIKQLNLESWNQWQSFEKTGCTGICGTNGWRMRNTYLDSGTGHGEQVQVWFELDVIIEQEAELSFTHILQCKQQCKLSFSDANSTAAGLYSQINKTVSTSVTLRAGAHQLRWTFLKYATGSVTTRADSAQIFDISVAYVKQGGAPECLACPPGTYSADHAAFCSNCSAGYTSNADNTGCVLCPGNTFSAEEGGVCMECGLGTYANANHTDCLDECTITVADAYTGTPITYDLNPLAANGRILGPFWDGDYFDYSVNVCGRGGFKPDCHTDENLPLISHICQYDSNFFYGIDLGIYPAYYPSADPEARGVRVEYTGGSMGCGPWYGEPVGRSSTIEYICDPDATYTYLDADLPLEHPPCHYNFYVRTPFACPACSEADYGFYYTTCTDGQRLKVYYNYQEKPQCVGNSLPPSELVACQVSTLVCPPGSEVDESSGTPVCKTCIAGSFSVGGAQYVNSWINPVKSDALITPFVTYCSGLSCTPWADSGYSIQAGDGTSVLAASYDLVTEGYVSFNYKVYSAHAGLFTFSLDGLITNLNTPGTSKYEWTPFHAGPLPAGRHVFIWTYTGGSKQAPSTGDLESALITDFQISGTEYSGHCLPCPPGTYSAANSSSCTGCAPDTSSKISSPTCDPCPWNQFSLGGIGADTCLDAPECTDQDFWAVYEPCINGSRWVSFAPLSPKVCTETGAYTRITISCGASSCPPTLFWNETAGTCVSCASNQYYSADTNSCENIPVGYANVKTEYYFNPFYIPPQAITPDISSSSVLDAGPLPLGFTTSCSGVCGSPGWRTIGNGVDSGYHGGNTVDSYLVLNTNIVSEGSLSFDYNVIGDLSVFSGLQLEIDGATVLIDIPYPNTATSVYVPLTVGSHEITWNYHQDTGDIGLIQVRNVIVVGTETGSSVAVACPAGTRNPDANPTCSPCGVGSYAGEASSDCTPCDVNTFNPSESAEACIPCGFGTHAHEPGAVYCQTPCIFGFPGADSFDLTTLTGAVGPVRDKSGNDWRFAVCDPTALTCDAHVCMTSSANVTTNGGGALTWISLANTTDASEFFQIRYDYGDSSTCHPGQTASTFINFYCDPTVSEAAPRFVDTDSDSCNHYFAWRTILGCPTCVDSDYTIVTGECDGTQQSQTKIRQNYCNGAETVALASQACTIPANSGTVAAIVIAIIAFVIIVALAAFFWMRQRKLTKHYSMLLDDRRRQSVELRDTVTLEVK